MSFAVLFVVGCGGASTGPSTNGIDIKIAPFHVPPGGEVQNCFYMKVPSDVDLELGHVVIDFAQGTHHMHVYYGDEQHADGSEECFSAVDFDKWHLLVGAQKPHLEWELPPNVAFHLKAHQQLLVQVHFVNASTLTTANNTAQGTIHFDTRKPSEVKMHMGSIFGQQRAIDIKPYSKYSVDGICKLPHELSMGALAGHYHFKGQDFVASRMQRDGSTEAPFYMTSNFAEPKFDIYGETNPLRFAAGDRILWHCDYDNETAMEIPFGPKELSQEHCNMFAFYYPAQGLQEFTPCVAYGRCATQCASDETCSEQGECVKTSGGGDNGGPDGGTGGSGGSGGGGGGVGGSGGTGGGGGTCVPRCRGKQCGDDGCGGSCGSCASGTTCGANGQCAPACSCAGKQCGDDGCGNSCGSCATGQVCSSASMCVAATCDNNGGVEIEPNDKSYEPNALCSNGVISGTIATLSDVDWYSFPLAANTPFSVTLSKLPGDYTFAVYRRGTAPNSVIKLGDAPDNHDLADQTFTATAASSDATYLVKVYSFLLDSDATRPYTLTLTKQ